MFRKTLIALTAATAMTTSAMAAGHSMDIVDTAMGNEDFETLVAAVSAADLVDALKGEGPFTVFAPTDEAFDALPEGTLEMLLMPENKDQLIEILTYHVVPGKVMSSDIMMQPTEVETLQGTTVTVTGLDTGVTVDGSRIEMADIETSNGVIHIINKVLMP